MSDRPDSASVPTDTAPFVQRVRELASAFQASRVLLSAVELDLFTALHDERRSSAELAEAIGTDARATDRLMNALCALGLLEKRDGLFANTPLGARHLVRGRPGHLASLAHSARLFETWSALTDVVRAAPGGAVERADRGDDWLRPFIAAMHWRGRQAEPSLVSAIDLTGVSRLLDVGGGSGVFAAAFVRARAGVTAVVIDLPDVVPLARGYIASEGLGAEIEVVAGDYTRDELPSGFDLVLLSAILHSNGPDMNRRLLGQAARALNPGGRVLVTEFLMNEDRTGPLQSALFAINMLVNTAEGDTYTEAEIRGWMRDAGFDGISRVETAAGASLLVGRKP